MGKSGSISINNLNATSTTIFNNLTSLSTNSILGINNLNATSTTIFNNLNSLSTNSILGINNLNATSITLFDLYQCLQVARKSRTHYDIELCANKPRAGTWCLL
jgi:hypothetical protein